MAASLVNYRKPDIPIRQPPAMRTPQSLWISGIFVTFAVCLLWWGKTRPTGTEEAPLTPDPSPRQIARVASPAVDPLPSAFENLRESPDSLRSLMDLQQKLASMPPAEAAKWIRDFLKTGRDKSTGLSFEIAADHSMKQWPTFRTFLLDALRAIDPAAAAEVSREILTAPTTADEWALALRNIGLTSSTPETNAELRAKTEALIANPEWQADPSVGYLNAFDVLVHTRAVESTPLLSELVQRKDRKDLAHAAFLTLDRLVQRAPEEVLENLAADKNLQQSRPEMTAQQFARADLRDPAQQAIVKSWLLDPSRSGTELSSFSGVYPNNNHFVSNNLLTTEPTQSGSDLAAHDRAALEIITSWSEDPTFAPVKDHLTTMIRRLNSFVTQPTE